MNGLPIHINNVSGNGVVNVGGARYITPLTVSKTVFGSGGSNTGIVFQYNLISQTKALNSQYSDQNVTRTI
ncbi:spore germination protein [Bacillus vallismortis]|uniref:spore germination protein n=1 Tax=Bacillus vallismortis TaxID=72361 RepID=UPI0020909787|nr:spore germination protein [Bacillus vallismortis]MCO4850049.1 spore germination protein [Bacillus vallismortis]